MDDVSQWFWLVLEQARPNLGRLATWLEVASRAEIEDLAREFRRAKQHVVADYSDALKGYWAREEEKRPIVRTKAAETAPPVTTDRGVPPMPA